MKIKHWMDTNWLKMNDGKTEFILYESRQQLLKCENTSMNINGNSIERVECIKYLGISLDKNLNTKKHVARKCKTAMFNLLKIKKNMANVEHGSMQYTGARVSHLPLDYSKAF